MRQAGCLALCALVLAVLAAPAGAAAPLTFSGPLGRERLAGPWTLRSDPGNAGLSRGWSRGGFSGRTVDVPFAVGADPAHLTGAAGMRTYAGTIAWYRTRLDLTAPGRYAVDFQSVNHLASVWLDGRLLGRHTGEYQPFSETFTASRGPHQLVVRADSANIDLQRHTGWHRTWFNFGGINREVTLRRLSRSDIATPTLTTTLGRAGRTAVAHVTARVHNRAGTRRITLRGVLAHGTRQIHFSFPSSTVAGHAWATLRTAVRVPSPALWSPAHPALYAFGLGIPGEAAWTGRTGLRTLARHGRRLLLNGRRLVLRGASLQEDAYGHGDALTPDDMDRMVAELRAIGANATRAQHPLTPALLDRLDAAGILVWQELGPNDAPGAWVTDTPGMRLAARRRVRESWLQLQLHPSIAVWSLANEIANVGHPGGQAHFIDRAARELHRRDPGRLVGVDVWGKAVPTTDRGALLYRDLDVVGLTNYAGWYEGLGRRGPALQRMVARAVGGFARAFADKVIVVSEFGAEANRANPANAPGGMGFQARLLRDHLLVYGRDDRLAGVLVWALRDFAVVPTFSGGSIHRLAPGVRLVSGIDQKGLFDYRGRPKPAVAVVRRLLAGGG